MKLFNKILSLIFAINLLSVNMAEAVLTNSAPSNYQSKPKSTTNTQRQYSNNYSRSNSNVDPDFAPYMENLQRRIKSNWEPPKTGVSTHVTVLFKLDRYGRLLDSKITESSGNREAERAAIRALEMTAPFGDLPSSYTGSSVDVQFKFDYNVQNNNY